MWRDIEEYFEGYPGTHLSDIYSLGVIVYEMLTGHLPYGGPLSERKLKKVKYIPARQHNPEIPAWVDGALEKATQLNPRLRYDLMSEFVADLSRPNPELIKASQPLLEKNPLAFWKALSAVLALINLVLLYLLLAQ